MPKLTKNEQGVGTIFIIVVIVVVLAVAGVIIWKATEKNTNSTTPSSSSKTLSNTAVSRACQNLYKDNNLCAFAEHTNLSSIAYEATGNSSSTGGKTATFTVKSDGKGNTEVVTSSNGQQQSSITLDGNIYLENGTGTTWLEYSSGSVGAAVPNPTSGFDLNLNSNSETSKVTVIKDGTVACGSLTCYKYQVKVPTNADATQYVYFDTGSYLLREWTFSDSTIGDSSSITFSYPSVSITKPSPVQQVSASTGQY